MKKLANKLTDKLVLYQIIEDEDKDLYSYGIWQGIVLFFNFATALAISCSFQMLWQGIVFTIAYGFLRSYAGGYHSRTQTGCYLFSVVLITAVLSLIKFAPWNNVGTAVILILSATIILALSPQEDENKKLDEKEQIIFKKRTHIVLFVLIGLTLLSNYIGKLSFSICIVMSIATSAFMLVLGKGKTLFNPKRGKKLRS